MFVIGKLGRDRFMRLQAVCGDKEGDGRYEQAVVLNASCAHIHSVF